MNRDPLVLGQYLIPQRLVCRIVYRAARSRRRWLARPLMRWFASTYGLDLAEAAAGSVDDYDCLNALFTRALRPDARQIAADADAVAAPADGLLTACGRIDRGTLIQAKDRSYTLARLLDDDTVAGFEGGTFATIYLAPHDYHRVHVPVAARLTETRYIAGERFSVNERTAAGLADLFVRNERAVFRLDTGRFTYYLVMVGALNVSSISTATRGEIPSGNSTRWTESEAVRFAKGDEIGRFNLGSTAIVVLPAGVASWTETPATPSRVRMGQRIARLTDAGTA